jgi:hypothetical protein
MSKVPGRATAHVLIPEHVNTALAEVRVLKTSHVSVTQAMSPTHLGRVKALHALPHFQLNTQHHKPHLQSLLGNHTQRIPVIPANIIGSACTMTDCFLGDAAAAAVCFPWRQGVAVLVIVPATE